MTLAATQTVPKMLPGTRMLAGKVYVFNETLLNAHLADVALEAAPADLSGLSDGDLTSLFYQWLNADARRRGEVAEVGKRICDERVVRAAADAVAPLLIAAE